MVGAPLGGIERRLDGRSETWPNVGTNPRVPLSTCDGKIAYRPRGVDLLIPIRLGNLSSEQGLLAGPVTVVGKLVRAVSKPGRSMSTTRRLRPSPGRKVDDTAAAASWTRADSDAVVLSPGAVILPIAIYK